MQEFDGADFSIVYVVTNPAMPGLVKIGKTTQAEADVRLGQLFNTSVPFPFKLEFACRVINPDEVERALHVAFAPHRVNPRREFFEIDSTQAVAILKLLHTQDATEEVSIQIEGGNKSDSAAGEAYSRKRRPNLNFTEMGIPIGSELSFVGMDATATVVEPKKVRFQDRIMSLTEATRTALELGYSVAPSPYWTFSGRVLTELYNETYPLEDY